MAWYNKLGDGLRKVGGTVADVGGKVKGVVGQIPVVGGLIVESGKLVGEVGHATAELIGGESKTTGTISIPSQENNRSNITDGNQNSVVVVGNVIKENWVYITIGAFFVFLFLYRGKK